MDSEDQTPVLQPHNHQRRSIRHHHRSRRRLRAPVAPKLMIVLLAILSLTTLSQSVSLADFRPSASGLTGPCGTFYTTPIDSCSPSDFLQGTACSQACVASLESIATQVWDACGGSTVNSQGVIQAFLLGQGVAAVCPNEATSTSSALTGQAASTTLAGSNASMVTSASLAFPPTSYPNSPLSSWVTPSASSSVHNGTGRASATSHRASSLPSVPSSSQSATPPGSTRSPTTSAPSTTSSHPPNNNNPPLVLTATPSLQNPSATDSLPNASSTSNPSPQNPQSGSGPPDASSADCQGLGGGMQMNGHHCSESNAASASSNTGSSSSDIPWPARVMMGLAVVWSLFCAR